MIGIYESQYSLEPDTPRWAGEASGVRGDHGSPPLWGPYHDNLGSNVKSSLICYSKDYQPH